MRSAYWSINYWNFVDNINKSIISSKHCTATEAPFTRYSVSWSDLTQRKQKFFLSHVIVVFLTGHSFSSFAIVGWNKRYIKCGAHLADWPLLAPEVRSSNPVIRKLLYLLITVVKMKMKKKWTGIVHQKVDVNIQIWILQYYDCSSNSTTARYGSNSWCYKTVLEEI